ncbi:metal-dependent hydrolase [Candidatus Parcubacteria bacterium]|nr:metal-dependent hydrolase [Candidatus Parcubacteria bacterium]
MTPAGHLAGGYLVGTAIAQLIPEARPFSSLVIGAAMAGSVFPDIDLIYHLFIKQRRPRIEYNSIYHRAYPTHAPSIYGVGFLALLPRLATEQTSTLIVALAFFAGILLHFLQDSFGVGPGIRWLWPLKRRYMRAPNAYRADGSFRKNVFIRPTKYIYHWLCWTEATLVAIAVFVH